jgi:hypothetical protein
MGPRELGHVNQFRAAPLPNQLKLWRERCPQGLGSSPLTADSSPHTKQSYEFNWIGSSIIWFC